MAFVTPVVEHWLEREICDSTGPDGAVVMSSAYGLVGTGFASRYWLQPRAGF